MSPVLFVCLHACWFAARALIALLALFHQSALDRQQEVNILQQAHSTTEKQYNQETSSSEVSK